MQSRGILYTKNKEKGGRRIRNISRKEKKEIKKENRKLSLKVRIQSRGKEKPDDKRKEEGYRDKKERGSGCAEWTYEPGCIM